MTAKPKNAPELRFPGFASDWNESFLSDAITSLDAGVSVNSEDSPAVGHELGILKTSCVTKGYFEPSENKRVLDPSEIGRLKEPVSRNSIVISRMNTPALVGLSGLVTQDEKHLFLPDRLWAAKVASSHSPHWLAQLLASEKVRGQLSDRASGTSGSMKNITKGDVLSLSVVIPTLPEQRKIADFLSAVDGRIGQLSQKKALLEDYKKGVMQQLFTQALRFKDDHGNDFPAWEEKKYSEIYTFQNTNSYSRDLLTYEGGEVRNIHYGDIHTKFRSNFYLSQEVVPFIKPEVELKRIAKDCYCRVGDLVIADASEDYADVGKCIEIMELGEKTLAGLHTFIARPRKGAISSGFGGYLMQSREVRLKIMTIAQGTKVLGLSKNMLCNIKLPIPHPDEQTKIANFLTALDRKIESVSTQITGMQTWKKGLLQQMFV
jgi:type I restriction enzyme S subunit